MDLWLRLLLAILGLMMAIFVPLCLAMIATDMRAIRRLMENREASNVEDMPLRRNKNTPLTGGGG